MRVKINRLWLSHYVSETAFERNDEYAGRRPVFFDDIVVSTEYVGPIQK